MKSFLKITYSILLTLIISLTVLNPAFVYGAGPTSDVQDSLDKLDKTAEQAQIIKAAADGKQQNIYQITGKIISAGLVVLTVIFFIITIYGGIIWMSAFGNEEKATKASKTLSQGGVGLGITLIAYLLTNYVVLKIVNIVTTQ